MKKIKQRIGKLLCSLGLHNWEDGLSGNSCSPLAHKCRRCQIIRIFHGWGYTYGYDKFYKRKNTSL